MSDLKKALQKKAQEQAEQKRNAAPSNTLEALHNRLSEIAEKTVVIQNVADAEQRALNEEEMRDLKSLQTDFDSVEAEIRTRANALEMEDRIRALNTPNRRRIVPDDFASDDDSDHNGGQGGAAPAQSLARPYGSGITGGLPSGSSKSTFGFRSMGEWAMAARRTAFGKHDQRIMNAPTTFGSEGVNEDGGFAVPPDFRTNIMKTILAEDSLLAMVDQQTTNGNSLSLPLDSTTPWQTSGGVVPQWVGEGGTIAQSKPKLGALETKLHKLAALVPITEELMADAGALSSWLSTKVPEKFTSFLNDVLINGDGIAKPLGMLNAACKVTVAAVSGQGAGTVVAKNITDMWARSYAPLRRNAVWLINQDVEPALQNLVVPGTNPSFPAYMPPGGFSGAPYSTLFGRPIMSFEACSALGTEGDIMLVIPSQYLAVLKGGMRTDVSVHLYFDTDHTAFKFVMRVGGQSYWPAAIARKNGSNTLSPIVTLNSTRT